MPKSNRSFDRMIIPAPCDADWDSMIGNDRVRCCEHCDLHVTNLSALTKQEAMRLVARSEGRLCVRFVRRIDGSVLSKQMPQKLHRISRRVSRLAAGAFSATLSLSSAAAQTTNSQSRPAAVSEQSCRSSALAPAYRVLLAIRRAPSSRALRLHSLAKMDLRSYSRRATMGCSSSRCCRLALTV